MSDLPSSTTKFTSEATTSGTINGSYAAPANHSVRAFFRFNVVGSSGGAPVTFEIYIADSFSSPGTSTSWAREKTNQAHAEALQGTALKYTADPTPTNAKLVETVVLSTLTSGTSEIHRVPGGKVIYCKAICATSPTVVGVMLKTDE